MTKKYTKEEIEMALWNEFLDLYNKAYGTCFSCLRNWFQWKEADIICDNNLQIEIVSNHYSEDTKKKEVYQMLYTWSFDSWIMIEPDKSALLFLLESLEEKNQKLLNWNYWRDMKTFLLIDLRENSLTTMLDVSSLIQETLFPDMKIEFDEVWLFHDKLNWDLPIWALCNETYCIWNFYRK